MAWNNTGSVVITAGAMVGTGTLFLSSFVGDAFVDENSGKVYEIATITDNTHATTAYTGLSGTFANGAWSVLPSSPLRQTTATLNNILGTIIGNYGSVLSVAGADKTATFNKTLSTNNAGMITQTGGVIVGRVGAFGDNNMHVAVSPDGAAWIDGILINMTTGLATLYGDPTAALGATTKQYVDGTQFAHSIRLASSVNVTTTNPGTVTYDGVAASAGDIVLLYGQSTPSQNGPWIVGASTSTALVRPAWWATGYVKSGALLVIQEGTANAGNTFQLVTTGTITVGTTSVSFVEASTEASLTSAHIFVGNASGFATDVAMTGVIAISNTGVTSFSSSTGSGATVRAVSPTITGTLSTAVISTTGNITISLSNPTLLFTDSTWTTTAYIQAGVNSGGTGAGSYLLFNVPTGKNFSWAANNAVVGILDTVGNLSVAASGTFGSASLQGSITTGGPASVGQGGLIVFKYGSTTEGYLGLDTAITGSGQSNDITIMPVTGDCYLGAANARRFGFTVIGSTPTMFAQFNTGALGVSGSNHYYQWDAAEFYPSPDNTMSLGTSTLRWTVVYAATGTINTSDERFKDWENVSQVDYRDKIKALWVGDVVMYDDMAKTKGARSSLAIRAQQAYSVLGGIGVAKPANEDDIWGERSHEIAHLALWGVKDLYELTSVANRGISALQEEVLSLKKQVAILNEEIVQTKKVS